MDVRVHVAQTLTSVDFLSMVSWTPATKPVRPPPSIRGGSHMMSIAPLWADGNTDWGGLGTVAVSDTVSLEVWLHPGTVCAKYARSYVCPGKRLATVSVVQPAHIGNCESPVCLSVTDTP